MSIADELISKFTTDSENYDLLQKASEEIADVEGISLEIGLRQGGGSKYMIDGLLKSGKKRTHIAIDPYGSMDYLYTDEFIVSPGWYPDTERDLAVPGLLLYCSKTPINFLFFQMTDDQFFKRFEDGVPVYVSGEEELLTKYALVHFDGPHTTETTLAETVFFEARASVGARFVYDDVHGFYRHEIIRQYLIERGWEVTYTSPKKIVYKKN